MLIRAGCALSYNEPSVKILRNNKAQHRGFRASGGKTDRAYLNSDSGLLRSSFVAFGNSAWVTGFSEKAAK